MTGAIALGLAFQVALTAWFGPAIPKTEIAGATHLPDTTETKLLPGTKLDLLAAEK